MLKLLRKLADLFIGRCCCCGCWNSEGYNEKDMENGQANTK